MAVHYLAQTEEHGIDDLLAIGEIRHCLAYSFVSKYRMIVIPSDIGVGWRVILVFFELSLESFAAGPAHHLHRLQTLHVVQTAALETGERRVHVVDHAKFKPIDMGLVDSFFTVTPII